MKSPPMASKPIVNYLDQMSKAALIDVLVDLAVREIGEESASDASVIVTLHDAVRPVLGLRRDRFPRVEGIAGICRICGCTNGDCEECIERTGEPCTWIEPDLCSACAGRDRAKRKHRRGKVGAK